MMPIRITAVVVAAIALAAGVVPVSGQMEKRLDSLYDAAAFAKAAPAVGTTAPDMELTRLDGTRVRLSDFRGQTLVLIKGGYT